MSNIEIIDKIKKLLNLSKSANKNEAESALAMANSLMLKHNLQMQEINAHNLEYREEKYGNFKKMPTEYKYIMPILITHFRVRVIKANNYFVFVGERSNIEIAKYVCQFLKYTYYNQFKKSGLNTALKQSFYRGLELGLHKKLTESKNAVQQEAGLVLVDDKNLDSIMSSKNLSTTKLPGPPIQSSYAQSMGYSIGEKININIGLNNTNKVKIS